MMLPCADPRDAKGLEYGAREFVDKSGVPLILYLKDEPNFGIDLDAGLDAVARMVAGQVLRGDQLRGGASASFGRSLSRRLAEACRSLHVISGIGERPAIVHMREWGLPGFTTGSGCVAPGADAASELNVAVALWDEAGSRAPDVHPVEDLRDRRPARVLHAASVDRAPTSARAGPIRPLHLGDLRRAVTSSSHRVARQLRDAVVRACTA